MQTKTGKVVMAEAHVHEFLDARGRLRQFTAFRCPCRMHGSDVGLVFAIRGIEPAHLDGHEALALAMQLRAGAASSLLRPSPYGSGRAYATTATRCARYVLAFDSSGVCDLLIAGGPVENVPNGFGMALCAAHREFIADAIEHELALNTGALAGQVAQA